METLFATPERDGVEDVRRAFMALSERVPYAQVLDLVPNPLLIINARRQLLFANAAARASLGTRPLDLLGARPGEVLDCVHAHETPGGCGTTEACRVCGAVHAMLAAIEGGTRTEKECRISTEVAGKPGSLDLRVTAVPIVSSLGRFALVTLVDISDTKRRQVLERLFFHDIMNNLSSLQSGMFLIGEKLGEIVRQNDYFNRVSGVADVLVDEVLQQKQLFMLENGDLEIELHDVDVAALARDLVKRIEMEAYAMDRRIALVDGLSPRLCRSDPGLLGRVLLNMLKNALEASHPGEEIGLVLADRDGSPEISVHNSAFIPRDYQLQIFQRSFSTKGGGRGIGTYCMKMLAEEYLEGQMGFSSDEEEGTTFTMRLPGAPV